MEEVQAEANVPAHGAEKPSFWTPERIDALRRMIPVEPNAKDEAIDKLRALHPKLKKPKAIQKRLDGSTPDGLAIWLTPEFWKREVDLTLIEGIFGGRAKRPQVIQRIQAVFPEFDGEGLRQRMETLAAETQPEWFQKNFWEGLDPILLAGMRQGKAGERKAVDKILREHHELRVERVWARVRELRRQNRKGSEPRAGPWTNERDERLLALCSEMGLKNAVSVVQRETGWPRDSIVRRVHKLGIPKKQYQRKQEWSEIDRTFLLVSVRHVPVKKIARQLGRPEKAVWVQIWREGLRGAWEEGYSRRELCRKFRVSGATLRGWIRAELMKDGADGRVPERSVREFLRHHRELVDWDRLDPEDRQWTLELCTKDQDGEADGSMEESGGDGVKPSAAKQLAATAQT
jgi:hypothetical protein